MVETVAFPRLKTGDEIDLVMKLALEEHPIQVRPRTARVTSKAIGVEFVKVALLHAMAWGGVFMSLDILSHYRGPEGSVIYAS